MNLYALVVIYNKPCNSSKTLSCLMTKKKSNMKIIVFDNSIFDFGNEKYCEENQIKYFSYGKNIGLSRAYNLVISTLDLDSGHIIILDDDTTLSEDYLQSIIKITSRNIDPLIIIPTVRSNETIISPRYVFLRSLDKSISNLNRLDFTKVTAINSGTVINLKVFKRIKYNENLFLDYVDHEFMRMCRRNHVGIVFLKVNIYQDFYRSGVHSLDSALSRFKIMCKDYREYAKLCNGVIAANIYILKQTIHNCIKYKSIEFVRAFLGRY